MVNTILERELHEQLGHLPLGQQRQVLDFARALGAAQVQGVPGEQLLHFAGTIPLDDLKLMSHALKDCEKVDEHDW